MSSVFDVLKERGFIAQITHEEEVKKLLSEEKVTFYIGFDPTADSLHIGHFLQLMVMAHMQQAGHVPIVLIGGGTAMVGDPTGKNDMRKMMTREIVKHNADSFKTQISKFIDFSDNKAIMVDNGDWLMDLNYVQFLREVGVHFSVNRMLTAECFKSRMEKGLTFLEFNYMLMQSYDFLVLNDKYGCKMELGGDDQWSNILGGINLVRKSEGRDVYGMTFKLLTTSEGKKMGKTENGAVWLDPEKTTPYEFYQYWRNIADNDVENCLALMTFLPMDEVRRLGALKDAGINEAKAVLAYEVTKIVHGEEEAKKAKEAAEAIFGGKGKSDSIPFVEVKSADIEAGIKIIDLLMIAGLTPSKSEARRAVQQGGVLLNDEKITAFDYTVGTTDLVNGEMMLQKGKKSFVKVKLV
ncbi:tyrosyl-tRNA synthetase [Ruminiclostridium papyrosolvens DSM 2782]|uniref:Tyrosine--tRNA ligase n=1 Tax=Ruminiclostridium papyrosolvens DSM 2782 TaxID=588581 RepID=F1THT2_9FIRM|nr:tyrosine--tRNA ligase [Ruminiclostridium papyrosolvens]EGD46064.1 tyrosyl-tRNA synthetase [Ruminiclostridium papyrosolvens DSM 2782]WES32864.1 tyrosine--tRNA ligase [Ruminiclostridium papyrosolvens DSM 2782]